MTKKMVLEEGTFNWEAGRGYQPPAGGGGLPPGWLSPPEGLVPESHAPVENLEPPPVQRGSPDPAPSSAPPQLADTIMDALNELLGAEYISVSNGTAVFMNHDLTLSADGLATIKMILGWEVCRQLESEKERILGSVLVEGLPPTNRFYGIGKPDLPPVPSAQKAMVAEEPGDSGEVQRVRVPKSAAAPKDVRVVPRKKANKAGKRSEPRRAVPSPDDSGMQG